MNYKPDEATLISYLYGELDDDTHRKVEEYLSLHPAEKKRTEEWSFARNALTSLSDKEVIAPPLFLEEPTIRPFWKENYFRKTMAIAASFLFILVAARFLGFSASYSAGELRMGFANRESNAGVSQQQVADMISTSLANNNQVLQATWNEDRESLEKSIQKNVASGAERIDKLMVSASKEQENQVKKFLGKMQEENVSLLKDYLNLSAQGQKEYVQSLLLDFSKYLQEQRKQDIQTFQARLNKVEENTDQFKQETEQLLTNLMTSTSATESQRRN